MESTYPPQVFGATEPTDLETYFTQYKEELGNFHGSEALEDKKFNLINKIIAEDFKLPLSVDDIKELDSLCSIDKLTVTKENPQLPISSFDKTTLLVHPINDSVRHLNTVKLKEQFGIALGVKFSDNSYPRQTEVQKTNTKNIKPGSSFIIRTLLHIPFAARSETGSVTNDKIRVQYDIELLATNTLLDLANAIKCPSDSMVCKEMTSIDVDFPDFKKAKDEYPSRFFFIDGIFYNDLSHPNCIDLSEVVRDWASKKGIGHFETNSMEVSLGQLKPRFGYAYVYIHQGNCEHIVTFSDARLAQNCDDLDSRNYPKQISHASHLTTCSMCHCQYGFWLVANSNRLTQDRALLCQRCCQSYMFLDGKKLGTFQLYPYYTEAIAAVIGENEEEKKQSESEEEEGEGEGISSSEWGYLSN